eukprot:2498589-Alexandrium_andersonii.AAC.1
MRLQKAPEGAVDARQARDAQRSRMLEGHSLGGRGDGLRRPSRRCERPQPRWRRRGPCVGRSGARGRGATGARPGPVAGEGR